MLRAIFRCVVLGQHFDLHTPVGCVARNLDSGTLFDDVGAARGVIENQRRHDAENQRGDRRSDQHGIHAEGRVGGIADARGLSQLAWR